MIEIRGNLNRKEIYKIETYIFCSTDWSQLDSNLSSEEVVLYSIRETNYDLSY